jgi:hypothetical protein
MVTGNLRLVGTRIFFGDEFVAERPFELQAADFFNRYDETDIQPTSFGKRVGFMYQQKHPEMLRFLEGVRSSSAFECATWNESPSRIGLPNFISYVHRETAIAVEFDGLVFVCRKVLADDVDLNGAVSKAQQSGLFLNSIEVPHSLWDEYFFKVSAQTHWTYVFDAQLGNRPDAIFAVRLNDPAYLQVTFPTGTSSQGRDFLLMTGEGELVTQILAHDAESQRYLLTIRDQLSAKRNDILAAKTLASSATPVVPFEFLSVFRLRAWRIASRYWTDVHRALEKVLRIISDLNLYESVADVYEEYAVSGTAFRTLENPLRIPNGTGGFDIKHSGYPTPAPVMIEKSDEGGWKVVGYDRRVCGYSDLSESIKKKAKWTRELAEATASPLQALAASAAVQATTVVSMITAVGFVVAIVSLVIAVFSIAMTWKGDAAKVPSRAATPVIESPRTTGSKDAADRRVGSRVYDETIGPSVVMNAGSRSSPAQHKRDAIQKGGR